MQHRETELSKLEGELLKARKRLNELVYEYHIGDRSAGEQMPQGAGSEALYRDKMEQLEDELGHLQRQLQLLKGMGQVEQAAQSVQTVQSEVRAMQPEAPTRQPEAQAVRTAAEALKAEAGQKALVADNLWTQPALVQTAVEEGRRKPRDYEKMFGKNFMGIFASGLIFISLIIFATLIVPYLDDTLKLLGMYILSFGILAAGLLLYYRHMDNKFYVAVIGCGTGALYLSLLMSDLYFKVIGDIALYCLILVWAVLVKWLTRLKNLVFQIIGHVGIFIATFLGTVLCIGEGDEHKFFVLTVFYLLSVCIFSDLGREELHFLLPGRRGSASGQAELEVPAGLCYEKRFWSHISRTLNASVFLLGYFFMRQSGFKVAGICLLAISLFAEYYVSYREKCRHGLAFQMFSTANAFLLTGFFHASELFSEEHTFIFMYLVAIALLFYVEKKDARFRLLTQVCGLILALLGCANHYWIKLHLFAYITVIPCLFYGKWKNSKFYLYAGISCMAVWLLLPTGTWFMASDITFRILLSSFYRSIELSVMVAAVYAVFLYTSHRLKHIGFKISGYILLSLIAWASVSDMVFGLLEVMRHYWVFDYNHNGISWLIAFFVIAVIHLVLNKLEYLGEEKPVEVTMLAMNALLMVTGCRYMGDQQYYNIVVLQLLTILITVLLFLSNSKKQLSRHRHAGYYIAFKYTFLMVVILNSFQAVNYVISICLLLFAIASIVMGFYRDNISFRLYGLVLSMISVIKLIMIDIHYDSTLENALSFFVSGVLCFVISFIYHKIDLGFKKK